MYFRYLWDPVYITFIFFMNSFDYKDFLLNDDIFQ